MLYVHAMHQGNKLRVRVVRNAHLYSHYICLHLMDAVSAVITLYDVVLFLFCV